MTLDDLLKLPEELIEQAHKAIEERRREKHMAASLTTEARLKQADRGHGDFKPEELNYAAIARCLCGHGMAYPEHVGMHGAWQCSAILKGVAVAGTQHTEPQPFAFWSIKGETQAGRVQGRTTRPADEPLHKDYLSECSRAGIHTPPPRSMPSDYPKESNDAST